MGDEERTPGHQRSLPDFQKYIDKSIITKQIQDIHQCSFAVEYQKNNALGSQDAIRALMHDGYDVLNDLLESSGIHYLHVLEAKSTPSENSASGSGSPNVEFLFQHDRMHCSFQLRGDRFEIRRSRSSFSDFYEWYSVVMPEAARIESTFRQIVQRASGHTLRPVQSKFEFVFHFSNFRKLLEVEGESPRNMDVLETIIQNIPGSGRTMTRPSEQDLYRLDLMISKRTVFSGRTRNTWLGLEAPFNEGGRFIVFTAQLRNTAAEVLSGNEILKTEGFDLDFGSDYEVALMGFLRDEALESFAFQLLRNWKFETERHL